MFVYVKCGNNKGNTESSASYFYINGFKIFFRLKYSKKYFATIRKSAYRELSVIKQDKFYTLTCSARSRFMHIL